MQADLLLYLRSVLNPYSGQRLFWYPRTLVYSEYHRSFDLFKRAASKRYFNLLRLLLNVKDKNDFVEKLTRASERGTFARVFDYGFLDYDTLLNIEELDTLP